MNVKIKVVIKEPGKDPRIAWISNSLKDLQKTVGGYIETVNICKDFVVICNEEGRLLGLPHSCNICGVDFVGTIILCGVRGDEFSDIPVGLEDLKRLLPKLWKEDEQ